MKTSFSLGMNLTPTPDWLATRRFAAKARNTHKAPGTDLPHINHMGW